MKGKIFRRFFLVILVALIICGIVLSFIMGRVLLQSTQEEMWYAVRQADVAFRYDEDLTEQVKYINERTMAEETRITILTLNGEVLADSTVEASDSMESHLEREEVADALNTGYGFSRRISETLGTEMLYLAYRSEQGDYIVRLALKYEGMWNYIPTFVPGILVGILIALVVSLLFANRLSKTISEPLGEISKELIKIKEEETHFQFAQYEYDELNDIVSSVVKLSDEVKKSMSRLERERKKIDYILENMAEGFILLDQNQTVLTINQAAIDLLHSEDWGSGRNIIHYTQNIKLIHALEDTLKTTDSSTVPLNFGEKVVSAHITQVQEGVFGRVSGAVVLLLDITAEYNAAKIRQEFFSNASHELKTPITSIQGYAELLQAGLYQDEEQKNDFIARILTETQRMGTLISDILMISKLENGKQGEELSDIPLRGLIGECVKSVEPIARKQNVSISYECPDVNYYGASQKLSQVLNNLVVNAVKYNQTGGSVKVTATKSDTQLILVVADTGIGIPESSRMRVFERFYRVDKGRSRKIGGTGLGLSIVKHIVQSLGGTICLESELDVGTTVTVSLPVVDKQSV